MVILKDNFQLTTCSGVVTCKRAFRFTFSGQSWSGAAINFLSGTTAVPGPSAPTAVGDAQAEFDNQGNGWDVELPLVKLSGYRGLYTTAKGSNNQRASLLHNEQFTSIPGSVTNSCSDSSKYLYLMDIVGGVRKR